MSDSCPAEVYDPVPLESPPPHDLESNSCEVIITPTEELRDGNNYVFKGNSRGEFPAMSINRGLGIGRGVVRLFVAWEDANDPTGDLTWTCGSGYMYATRILTARHILEHKDPTKRIHKIQYTHDTDGDAVSCVKYRAKPDDHSNALLQACPAPSLDEWKSFHDVALLISSSKDPWSARGPTTYGSVPAVKIAGSHVMQRTKFAVLGYPLMQSNSTEQLALVSKLFYGFQVLVGSEGVPTKRKRAGCYYRYHNCDTAGGMSGGPVFDDSGRLVGAHVGAAHDGLNANVYYSIAANDVLRKLMVDFFGAAPSDSVVVVQVPAAATFSNEKRGQDVLTVDEPAAKKARLESAKIAVPSSQ